MNKNAWINKSKTHALTNHHHQQTLSSTTKTPKLYQQHKNPEVTQNDHLQPKNPNSLLVSTK
jgi:hypothetical protein